MSDIQSKPRFLTVLSISILLFVFTPVIFSAGYFIYNTYQDALIRAQRSVDLQAKSTALEVKNKLSTLHSELLNFSQNQVMGEVSVNLLYSQFATQQLQKMVQKNEMIAGAFIADGSDFIVEAYPYEMLRIGTADFNSLVNELLQTNIETNVSQLLVFENKFLSRTYMELLSGKASMLIYLPLKKRVDSLVVPYKVTAGLFVLIDVHKLPSMQMLDRDAGDLVAMAIDDTDLIQVEGIDGSDYLKSITTIDVSLSQLESRSLGKKVELTYYSDTARYTADIKDAVTKTLIFMLVMLIVVLLALAFFASHITSPMIHLLRFSRRLSKGDYTESNFVANYQEFSELISHLNGMASTIQKQLTRLESEKENAQNSEKIKARFLANMSHEIRTPLNGILGLLKMLSQRELDPQASEWVEASVSSSNLLLNIVNDILDFSKLEEGKVEIEHTYFSIRQIIESVVHPHKNLIVEKGLNLTINYTRNMREFWIGDPMRISQVLLNFLSNAIKFTETGSIHLNVSAKMVDYKWYLEIEIEDTGIGMTEEQQVQLFKSFQQADVSTTRKYGGTGLGLSIAHKLVELMGGEIKVKSDIDLGTRFTVTIAVLETDKRIQAEQQVIVPDFSNCSVLVAEDNKINQLILKHILAPTKASVVFVEDGEAAVTACAENNFELILMDVQMPIMDGLQAMVELRKQGFTMPIVMQTANVLVDEIDTYLKNGANAHIAKPIVDTVLYKTMSQFLRLKLSKE